MPSATFQTRVRSASLRMSLSSRSMKDLRMATGVHADLFELLRGLGQGVEFAGVGAAGDEEFAGAFGCGFEEDGGLDFEEALFVEEDADGGGGFAADAEVAGHLGAAKVEVAVF